MEVLCWYIVEADWLLLLACVLMTLMAAVLVFRNDGDPKPEPNRCRAPQAQREART